jgi:hypothetical protein
MHHSLKNLGRSQEEEKKKKAYPSNGMLCKEEKK